MMRKKVLNDIQQGLTKQPLPFQGANVKATLELDSVKRPWNKAQAIFIGVMRDDAKLPRETFDIRWVDSGLRVSLAAPTGRTALAIALASFTIAATWVLSFEKFPELAPQLVIEAIQTLLLDARHRGVSASATEASTPWLFCTINLNREKCDWCCEWLDDLRHKHHILHEFHCFYALQEIDHWTTSAMNVPGYTV